MGRLSVDSKEPLQMIIPAVKGRSGDQDDSYHVNDKFPKKYLIICIGAGACAVLFITIIIIAVLVK